MRLPATARWIALALLGLAIATAVGIAASNLASQQIGIASESITAGERLAPAVRSASRQAATPQGHGQRTTTTTTTPQTTTTSPPPETTATAPTTTPTPPPATTPSHSGEPGDDHGGGGHSADD